MIDLLRTSQTEFFQVSGTEISAQPDCFSGVIQRDKKALLYC